MQFKLLSVLALASVALASPTIEERQSCSEADRFGSIELSKTQIAPGDSFHITSDFSCSYEKGIRPEFIDYEVRVLTNNNGHQPPVLLERRAFDPSASSVDEFDTTLPKYFYFEGSQHSVTAQLTYPVKGEDDSTVYIVGQATKEFELTGI